MDMMATNSMEGIIAGMTPLTKVYSIQDKGKK
jgi:hypothetical protein